MEHVFSQAGGRHHTDITVEKSWWRADDVQMSVLKKWSRYRPNCHLGKSYGNIVDQTSSLF